jgi:ABC-type multidrug transport system permease subunit
MLFADTYPSFFSVLWTMAVFFAWIIWFWLLIIVFGDLFRRKDIGGGHKVLWFIVVLVLPYLGVFIYLISNHDGMADRSVKQAEEVQQQLVATTPAGHIADAKALLDSGAITQAEFDSLKAKALAT